MNPSPRRAPLRPSARLSAVTPTALARHEKVLRSVRWLIYLYLILLLIEGALRKWVVPQLSNPLLIIRDPVVIMIYVMALVGRVFPKNAFMTALWIISILSAIAGALVLESEYFGPTTIALVTAYGFRSNFLHLPLIFILPAVFNIEDVKRIGWWTMLGMIPMSVLMALQFRASPDAFINRIAGTGEGLQIGASGGKIRPPGLFSFISGAISYMTVTAAFLLHAILSRLPYRIWMLAASGFSLIIALVVSGSRGAVLAVGVVVATLAVVLVLRPDALNKFGRNLLLIVLILWAASHLPIFHEGVKVLGTRFIGDEDEARASVIAGGLISRVFGDFTEPFLVLARAPIAGVGLGVGTNGAARFLVGQTAFLLAENEWSRILWESGPILGLAFLVWRTFLTFHIGYLAVRAVTKGRIFPILLYGTGALSLLNGQLGQPTSLGFAVVLSGLCLASMNVPEAVQSTAEKNQEASSVPRLPRRSAFAERLHGPASENGRRNDTPN